LTLSQIIGWKPANFTDNVTFGGISGDILSGNLAGSGAILNEDTSSFNPTLVPNKGETGYGIGYGSQSLHLIANEANVVEITDTYINLNENVSVSGNVTADYFFGNGSQLTGLDFAKYQFGANNFNGSGDLTTTGNIEGTGTANVLVIPTSDPSVAGAIWNDAGTLKVSAG